MPKGICITLPNGIGVDAPTEMWVVAMVLSLSSDAQAALVNMVEAQKVRASESSLVLPSMAHEYQRGLL